MKVAELITALQKLDPSLVVVGHDTAFYEVAAPLELRQNMHLLGREGVYPCSQMHGHECGICAVGSPKVTVVLV